METKQKSTKVKVYVLALAMLVLLTLSGPAWAVEGMISYWKFDEDSGTTAYDSFGNNHGTIYGATWTTGIVDGALSFDGVYDYVEVPDHPNLRGMSELTIEAWIYPSIVDRYWQGIVVKRNHYGPEEQFTYELCIQNYRRRGVYSCPQFVLCNGPNLKDIICYDDVVSTNEWYHLAGVYTGTTGKVYLNGNLCTEEPYVGGNLNNAPQRFLIGTFAYGGSAGYTEGYHFSGIIDEVAIYNRALTAEEIQEHYQNGLHGLGYLAVSIEIEIDIKPGSYPSSINLRSKGVTPVAIHTTSIGDGESQDFDSTTVDPTTVLLNYIVAPLMWEIYDCDEFENPDYGLPGEPEMIGDGDDDLVLYFDTQELADTGAVEVGDEWAILTGETTDGTPIEGTGDVNIVVTGKP